MDERVSRIIERVNFDVFLRDGEPLVYLSPGGVEMPSSVMKKIESDTYTEDDVRRWVSGDSDFESFPAPDEIRTELISLIRGDFLENALNLKTVERISGEELYRNYPIGDYVQQGDVIIIDQKYINNGVATIPRVSFEDLSPEMKITIRSNIFYELMEGRIEGVNFYALKMGNASFYNEKRKVHIEIVGTQKVSIFEAIIFRNSTPVKVDSLPCWLT